MDSLPGRLTPATASPRPARGTGRMTLGVNTSCHPRRAQRGKGIACRMRRALPSPLRGGVGVGVGKSELCSSSERRKAATALVSPTASPSQTTPTPTPPRKGEGNARRKPPRRCGTKSVVRRSAVAAAVIVMTVARVFSLSRVGEGWGEGRPSPNEAQMAVSSVGLRARSSTGLPSPLAPLPPGRGGASRST